MFFDLFVNGTEGGGCWTYQAWRCVCCGEVVDPLILSNRTKGRL